MGQKQEDELAQLEVADARTGPIHGSTTDSSYLGWEHEVDNLGFVVIPSLAK